MNTIRYISDLHLEFINTYKIQKIVYKILKSQTPDEILILAGDIGNPYKENYDIFMKSINKHFVKTFVIAGNHEYYGQKTILETKEFLKQYFQQHENISFLDNDFEIYKNTCFVGSTMWSHISNPAYEINDVYSIPDFDYKKYNKLNAECCSFLEQTVASNDSCVIITHHQPSEKLINEKYKTAKMLPYNQWFYCNMDNFILQNNHKIKCWIYGHTHFAFCGNLYGVPMYCNPIGYPGENPVCNFSKSFEF